MGSPIFKEKNYFNIQINYFLRQKELIDVKIKTNLELEI